MKLVPDNTGRFRERPHYEPAELDRECESIIRGFLRRLHGEVKFPVGTDDLTKLIERDAESLDQFADLSRFGDDIQGVTEFRPGKRPRVYIDAGLAEDERRENRLRTTLTHEWGHVHYHTYLFDFSVGPSTLLPSAAGAANLQICTRATMVDAPRHDWMEWQAGYVCGAILMPAKAVREFARQFVETGGVPSPISPTSGHGQKLIDLTVRGFQASRQAAEVRLLRLGVLSASPQMGLPL